MAISADKVAADDRYGNSGPWRACPYAIAPVSVSDRDAPSHPPDDANAKVLGPDS